MDADIPANVRIYSFGGTQHGPAGFPPSKGISDNYANFGDYRPFLRGLLVALDDWVREERRRRPASIRASPTGRWCPGRRQATGFPKIPGVRFPDGDSAAVA